MYILQVLPSQLRFLGNKHPELAVPPLFWPVRGGGGGGMLNWPMALLLTSYSVLFDSPVQLIDLCAISFSAPKRYGEN